MGLILVYSMGSWKGVTEDRESPEQAEISRQNLAQGSKKDFIGSTNQVFSKVQPDQFKARESTISQKNNLPATSRTFLQSMKVFTILLNEVFSCTYSPKGQNYLSLNFRYISAPTRYTAQNISLLKMSTFWQLKTASLRPAAVIPEV